MNNTELLVLHGPPGSGKSTLADKVSDVLRENNISHAVIDVDELARIYPEQGTSFQWDNLKNIWPHYAAIPGLKAILPVLIDSAADFKRLRDAAPADRLVVCELVTPEAILKKRVTAREPNEYWRAKLRGLVDVYQSRRDNKTFADFQVETHNRSVDETAREVIKKAGWETNGTIA